MIYFIFGKDNYRAKAKLKELIEKYSSDPAKDGTSFELQKIDGEKIKLDEFKNKLNSVSIFTQKRLIVVEDLSQNKEQKEFVDYLKEKINHPALKGTPPLKGGDALNDILIFFENKVDKKTSLYKFLKSDPNTRMHPNDPNEKNSFEFEELKPFELKNWVEKYIKEKGGEIERVALEEFLMNKKNDLWLISGEIEKMLAYNKKIDLESVQNLTLANFDDNIFNLADAVGNGNKKMALKLINSQIESGAAPIYLLSMIIRQFRILIMIKEASQKTFYSKFIAKELSLHPFVVQKTLAQTRNYSFEQLEKIYENLLEMDLQLKTSKVSPEVLFTKLVISN